MTNLIDEYVKLDPTFDYFKSLNVGFSTSMQEPVSLIKLEGIIFERLLGRRADVPKLDSSFKPLKQYLTHFNTAVELQKPMLLDGPSGCGKTAFIQYMAAAMNRPFYLVDVHEELQPEAIYGQFEPVEGNKLKWVDGPITKAYKTTGAFFLLDEFNLASPGILANMHRPFAKQSLNSKEIIQVPKGLQLFATGNSVLSVDDTSLYSGVHKMNCALLDRFGVVLRCQYPSKKEELDIITKVIRKDIGSTNYSNMVLDHKLNEVLTKVVDMAHAIRVKAKDELSIVFSIRKSLNWVQLFCHSKNIVSATKIAVLNFADGEAKEALEAIITLIAPEFTREANVGQVDSADVGMGATSSTAPTA